VLALLLPRERRASTGIEQPIATGGPVQDEPDGIETPGSATEVGEPDAEDR
jgi:hypothetical protein